MNANIAVLGLAGSGKTNFIQEAIKDINSFSPKILITEKPGMTSVALYYHEFVLKAYENIEWTFQLNDYGGSLLKEHDSNNAEVATSLNQADSWIILVDGDCFSSGDAEEATKTLKRKQARWLVPYVSSYAEQHQENRPELMIVISKSGKFADRYTKEELKSIILGAFDGLFEETDSPMILQSETSTTKCAGLAILTLFYLQYSKELSNKIAQLEKRNQQIPKDMQIYRSQIHEIESHTLLSKLPANKQKVADYNSMISSLENELSKNQTHINQCNADMGIRHLGVCTRCLADNNVLSLVNGFEKLDYTYEKAKLPRKKSTGWLKAMILLNIGIVIAAVIWLVKVRGVTDIFANILGFGIFGAFALSAISESKIAAAVICGFIALCQVTDVFDKAGINGAAAIITYVVWLVISFGMAILFDDLRAKRIVKKVQKQLIGFFDMKAKEKK